MVDFELIEKCKSGDQQAFGAMYESCAPYLYRVIQRYVYKQADQKDVLQETFINIFLYLKNFNQSKGKFKTWATKIAVNECFKLLNKKKKLNNLNLTYDEEKMEQAYLPDYTSLTKKDIDKYLINMPERYRMIFLLSEIDDYSHKEIAQLLQINESTSRSQLTRAKNWLRKNFLKKSQVK